MLMSAFLSINGETADTAYKAPLWQPGGHLQTIAAALLHKTPRIHYHRERWELEDGDFIDVDWVNTRAKPEIKRPHKRVPFARAPYAQAPFTSTPVLEQAGCATPVLIIFHGLEGSSQSHYAQSLLAAASAIGWQGALIHFRGCSGEPNRLPRFYYAGESQEIDRLLLRVRSMYPENPLYAVGYSLGGNALLKWLGELAGNSAVNLAKAVAVSAPADLEACAQSLDRGLNRWLYTPMFVKALRAKALALSKRMPGLLDEERIHAARTIHDIDNAVTAVLYGAKNASDYYRQNASKPYLKHIRIPTLVINAKNDPFLPARYLPNRADVSAAVTLDYPEQGGHVGFYSHVGDHTNSWLPKRILKFLQPDLLTK